MANVEYISSIIFRYRTEESYDIIWSSGIFGYLNEKAFVKLSKPFGEWQIVIGNYNEAHNPSRDYLVVLEDRHLIHRTEAQLLQLAKEASMRTIYM